MNEKFKSYTDAEKALQIIIDKTGDLGAGNSLSEKLQRLLDLPCEYCNDGEVIQEQQNRIDRLTILLCNALKVLEEQSGESVMDTDLEYEIGITREEYEAIMAEGDTDLNTKYDSRKFIYAIGVECQKNGEEFYDEYEPKSQSWEDIIAKYESEKNKLLEEIQAALGDGEPLEWLINDYQPITRFECDNGDWYEIYVLASEK